MPISFDYNEQSVFTKSIDVDDIGNVALKCLTEDLMEYYIIVKTVMGETKILEYGPVITDTDMLFDKFNVNYSELQFSDKKVYKEINHFINNKIDTVEIIDKKDVFKAFPEVEKIFMED